MTNTMQTDVAIIGGGPVGVALAILLSDRGIRSVVIDQHREVYPLPRAVHVDSEVYRILNQLGIGPDFAKISRPAAGLRLVDRRRRIIAQFDRTVDPGADMPEANLFDQPELEKLLRARLATASAALPLFGHDAVALQQSPGHVTVTTHGPDGERTVEALYAIGCDGANSWTRRELGIATENLGFEQRWLVIDVVCDAPLDDWGGVYQICDVERPGTFMRIADKRYRWEFRLPATAEDTPVDPASGRDMLRPWLERHPDAEVEFVRMAEYTFKAEVAERWRAGRVLLAGDAAHLTPPFIGQGLGAGLRDASNLAWKLAAVISRACPDALLDSYEAERKPHATGLIDKAIMIGRLMTGGDVLARVARGAVFPIASRIPSAGAKILNAVTPRFGPGKLVTSTTPKRVRGMLAPHVRLADARWPVSTLDEALSAGPILVVSRGDAAPADAKSLPRIVVDRGGDQAVLERWMRTSRIDWAIVRPDRTVLMAGRSGHELTPAEHKSLSLLGLS